MPFTLSGRLTSLSGPRKGDVYVAPSVPVIRDLGGNTLIAGGVTVALDGTGAFSIPGLPSTDDPAIDPQDFTYRVIFRLAGEPVSSVVFEAPSTVTALDVSDLVAIEPGAPTYTSLVTLADFAALGIRVTTAEADVDALRVDLTAEAAARISETNARVSAVDGERSAREAAIAAEASSRASADATETTARQAADAAETAARIAADDAHVAASDPHPQYLLSAEGDAKISAHLAAADPHPQYLTSAEGDAKVAAHAAAADPHPQYVTTAEGDASYLRGNVSAPVVYTNLVTNPSFESSTSPWTGPNGSTIALSSAVTPVHGTKVLAVTVPGARGPVGVGAGYSILNLKADTDYTFAVWAYVPTGAVDPVISVQGTAVGVSSAGGRTSVKDKWVRLVHTVRTTVGGQAAFYVLNAATTPASATTFYLDAAVLVEGAGAPAYFDGSSVGARWAGSANASNSERLLDGPGDAQSVAAHGARHATRYFEGIGSPEGVVQAAVGARYIDTAATNGAIEWIKASGATSAGWKVVYGDTGTRNVSGLVNTSIVTVITSQFILRRRGSRVLLQANDFTVVNSSNFLTLPVGFRPAFNYGHWRPLAPAGNSSANAADVMHAQITPSYDASPYAMSMWKVNRVAISAATRSNISIDFETDDPWPTTLPGTA